MQYLNTKINEFIRGIIEEQGFFLIDLVIRGSQRNKVIEIFVDGEKNVSAEDLAALSRLLGNKIDEHSLIDSSYRLDVSTPGVYRPLKFLQQFPKHLNRKFEILYLEDDETIKKFNGVLLNINGEDLLFKMDNSTEQLLNFNKIKSAKVLVSFS
jgi:ribosome maturation factor RimP